MTVKVALISIKAQILTPIEYPTQFFVTYDLYPEVIRMLHVSPGDKIRVFVRNHDAEVLRSNPNQITAYTAGYGIALPDGRFLVDPADVISGRQQFNNELNCARYLVVPVLWFVYMLWSSVRRRRKAAIAT